MFALRGTRLTKAGTVQADIQLMKDRDAELYYSQRALKHVHKHIRRLTLQQPDVQWGFFTTGARSLAACRAFFCAMGPGLFGWYFPVDLSTVLFCIEGNRSASKAPIHQSSASLCRDLDTSPQGTISLIAISSRRPWSAFCHSHF